MEKERISKKTCFVAARCNSDGTPNEFKDNNGRTYNYEQALEAVEQGMIENVFPFTRRGGARHVRGISDGGESTNPHNLKGF